MRCNPYGYGTDAGPARLMGGLYGPEYAGRLTTDATGTHGVAVCEQPASGRFRMVCAAGHARGDIMPLCQFHVGWIQSHYCETCTSCVWPAPALELNEAINRVQDELARTRDVVSAARLRARAKDLGRQMDELIARGIIAKRPLTLMEVS